MNVVLLFARIVARRWRSAGVVATACIAGSAAAGEASVAVAANFAAPMQKIAQRFEADTGHRAVIAVGSTGKFYAQIQHGAPFDMLLAADDETPARLERESGGRGRFTYAIGRLALWSAKPDGVDPSGDVLRSGRIERLAIADPRLAPYGAAAIETMKNLGVLDALRPSFVQGENIAQAYQFVASGNAALGFVALSQVQRDGQLVQGSAWVVPVALHRPIRQDALLLTRGASNPAATALLTYLRGDAARAIIRAHGYALP